MASTLGVLPEGKKIGEPRLFCLSGVAVWFDSRVVSAVGNDELGDEILEVFREKQLKHQLERVNYPTGTVQVTLDGEGVPCYDIKEGVAWDNIPFTDDLKRLALNTRAVCFGSLAQRNRGEPRHHQPLPRHHARHGWTVENIRYQSPPEFLYQGSVARIFPEV